jgi:hypothetical protein
LQVVEVAPAPRKARDAYLRSCFEFPNRLDRQSTEDLEERLLAVSEVSLDTTANPKESKALLAQAKAKLRTKQPYVGPLALGMTRPELAGLPYCIGSDVTLPREKAETMDALAIRLRETIQKSRPKEQPPDTGALFASLNAVSEKTPAWSTAKAVPCIRQMLQVENRETRRMSCELLRNIDGPEATAVLVQWAVFDTEAANRAAAVHVLLGRAEPDVLNQFVKYLRYPWAPAVEHACEALVALDGRSAIPALLDAKRQPDPDAPFEVVLPHGTGGTFRQDLVRVNHLKNCVLCHAPSQDSKEPLQAEIPDPSRSLSSPSQVYRRSGGELIAASTTYLRQDFSVLQPVDSPGQWPKWQRFDYFVTIRRELRTSVPHRPRPDSLFQRAYNFALQGLGAAVPDLTPSVGETRLSETARFVSLQLHPEALHSLKVGKPLLAQAPYELETIVNAAQHKHGAKASRVALVAYFAEAVESGPESQREKAERMLAITRGPTQDEVLSAKLARAAR